MLKACDLGIQLTTTLINELKSQGYAAAGLYTKHLDITQIFNAKQSQFGLFIIHEGMGNVATFAQGAARGQADGKSAYNICSDLKVPVGTTIFSAVDFPATSSQAAMILAYAAGFSNGCGVYNFGQYADGAILELEPPGVKTYVAGASSWPGTAKYLAEGKAALVQHPPVKLPSGVEIDPVDVIDERVIWWPGGKPDGVSPAQPSPAAGIMPMPASITALQRQLALRGFDPGPIDSIRGPHTQAALLAWYNSLQKG